MDYKVTLRTGFIIITLLVYCGCVSECQFWAIKTSLANVQLECESATAKNGVDGWGRPLVRIDDPERGTMVISLGQDGIPSRDLSEYWNSDTCGTLGSVDDEIVCVNGVLRRWPELNEGNHNLYRLPRECD